jgi:hypothetical protein
MQNVSTQRSRPLRIRTAVFLTILGLAAAAVAIELPALIGGSAPATSHSVTQTSVQAAGASLATHNRSEEGLSSPAPAAVDQSSEARPVRGPF